LRRDGGVKINGPVTGVIPAGVYICPFGGDSPDIETIFFRVKVKIQQFIFVIDIGVKRISDIDGVGQ